VPDPRLFPYIAFGLPAVAVAWWAHGFGPMVVALGGHAARTPQSIPRLGSPGRARA